MTLIESRSFHLDRVKMADFKRVFGFEEPPRLKNGIDPDAHKTYGMAAYGEWREDDEEQDGEREDPARSAFWTYEIGVFDYIWGCYRHIREDPRCLAAALYILDGIKNAKPLALVSEISMSAEWRHRYGDTQKHGVLYADLTMRPEDYRGVPPVDFEER